MKQSKKLKALLLAAGFGLTAGLSSTATAGWDLNIEQCAQAHAACEEDWTYCRDWRQVSEYCYSIGYSLEP
jgi:hypothetical protein